MVRGPGCSFPKVANAFVINTGFVLVMTLDSEVVGYAYPTEAGEFGCECPNCVYPLHANHTSSDKWNHGANQTLRLAGFPGPFYVSEIEVDILYHQRK